MVRQAGTFDPIQQGAYNPAGPMSAGQSLKGEHAHVFYHDPVAPVNCHWCSGGHVADNLLKHGNPRLMGVRAFRICSCGIFQ